jgi:hypothetical protein
MQKEKVFKFLGYCGKMISSSKSMYKQNFPKNIVVFNSNICTKEDGKIWYGDIDVTLSKQTLIDLSKELNKTIYVLSEMDARFENENSPQFERFIAKFNRGESYSISKDYAKYC